MARRMAEVVRGVHPLLKERAFRKRRNAFNRETEPGLVQVVALQMGRYELYGEQHDPFTGEYGRFWLSFGVWVAEIHRGLNAWPVPAFLTEAECELRQDAHRIAAAPKEGWYLGEDRDELVDGVRTVLTGWVLPYLDGLTTRDDLLAGWERDSRSVPLTRGRLAAALIHLARGDRRRAETLVREHLERGDIHPSHAAWVRGVVLPRLELQA
jgi:hypothetical protein